MHQILWLLYFAITWYKKSTSLPKLYLQNKAVKIIAGGQRHDQVKPFYYQLQILKLKDLHVY